MKRHIIYLIGISLLGTLFLSAYQTPDSQTHLQQTLSRDNIETFEELIAFIKQEKLNWVQVITGTGDTLQNTHIRSTGFLKQIYPTDPLIFEIITFHPFEESRKIFLTFDKTATSPQCLNTGATLWDWPQAHITIKGKRLLHFSPYVQVIDGKKSPLGVTTTAVPLGDIVHIRF